jgi:Secretion system C-terminal sorting domain
LYNVGGYETYTWNGTNYVKPGGAVRNFIESGEAVFVQSNSATAGSVTVKESDKGTGSALVSRVGVTRPTLEINMYTKDSNGADYLADGVMLNFDNTFSANIDNMDVRKINNTYDNLAIKNGSYVLVVERRPNLVQTDTIKLSIVGMRVSTYRLEIDPSVLVYPGLEAILKDKYLQTETPISFSTVTTQSFDITTDAASKVSDRFMIVFKPAATTNFTTIAATRNADKTITVNWGVQNETAVANYGVEQSNDGINFTTIATKAAQANNGTNPTYSTIDAAATTAANWYRVKANNQNATTKYTAVAMVNALPAEAVNTIATMSIYPNPVVDGHINLHLDNQAKGNYTVQITNAEGKTIHTENVQVQNNSILRIIKMSAKATGKYQATVIDETGNKTTIGFIIK